MSETKKDIISTLPNPTQDSDISVAAGLYVLKLFNEHRNSGLTYHNYEDTVKIIALVDQIGNAEENKHLFSATSIEIAQLAAWFYNTGFLLDYDSGNTKSIELSKSFLETQNYPADRIKKVNNCILRSQISSTPNSIEEQLFSDALNVRRSALDFFENSPLLRLEWELIQNRYLSNFDWNQIQMQYLLQARFYTPHAKQYYESSVAKNILIQKKKVQNAKLTGTASYEESGGLRKFQDLERKLPGDATQTFFRANYRNHINLSAIADNKANIMISVNAILISVLISLLTYQNITETNPMVLMPVVIFLVTGLTSLIFAILSIRPKVTSLNPENTTPEIAKRNIVFFGNFVHLDLEQYEEAMDAMFRDGELIYGNMVRDLYFLGKVLDKKYRFLTLAYNTFMIGFVATVLTFLLTIFT